MSQKIKKETLINKLVKYPVIFLIGAIVYMGIEILWRGYTHWTMGVLGGIILILIGLIDEVAREDIPLLWQAPIGSIIITLLEYYAGWILNIKLNLDIWDYSDLPFNVDGQVCLPFSLLWMFLSVVAVWLDNFIRWKLFNEPRKKICLI